MSSDGPTITSLELEDRRFPPPPEFAAQANADRGPLRRGRPATPRRSGSPRPRSCSPGRRSRPRAVDRSNPPFFKWFADGTLNASVNCLDRHLEANGDQVAFRWEGEPADERQEVTYRDLYERVCRLANGLRERGVGKGDRVAIYLGMIPEIVVAMLACARIGAPHTVIFGGFSPDSVRDRVLDCGVTAVITGDGAWRGGKLVPLKANVDAALEGAPDVHTCVVVRRTENEIGWVEGRDVWYHELVEGQPAEAEPEMVDAEHPLYILYTSGIDRQAEGHPPHHRRLPDRASRRPTGGSSTSRTTTSTGAPPTSAGSPGTATSSTARSPTAPPASSTRAPRARRTRTAGGRSSSATRSRSSTAPRPRSAPS